MAHGVLGVRGHEGEHLVADLEDRVTPRHDEVVLPQHGDDRRVTGDLDVADRPVGHGRVVGEGDLDEVARVVSEYNAVEIVIGIPVSLSGSRGTSAQAAQDLAEQVAGRLPDLAVRLVDERLTTVQAAGVMRSAGKSSKEQKARIDAAAATVLLQHVLDAEIATGVVPGTLMQIGQS